MRSDKRANPIEQISGQLNVGNSFEFGSSKSDTKRNNTVTCKFKRPFATNSSFMRAVSTQKTTSLAKLTKPDRPFSNSQGYQSAMEASTRSQEFEPDSYSLRPLSKPNCILAQNMTQSHSFFRPKTQSN